jgi:hypothetical protein
MGQSAFQVGNVTLLQGSTAAGSFQEAREATMTSLHREVFILSYTLTQEFLSYCYVKEVHYFQNTA